MKKKTIVIVILILLSVGLLINNIIPKANNALDYNGLKENSNLNMENIVVQIKGEVKIPGLYVMRKGSRINDLVNLSGGFSSNALVESINLASILEDGQVIVIQNKNKEEASNKNNLISINKGTIEDLMTLSGIGEAKAKNIIDYRNKNGNFAKLEDIMNVSGISETLFNKIKEFICL